MSRLAHSLWAPALPAVGRGCRCSNAPRTRCSVCACLPAHARQLVEQTRIAALPPFGCSVCQRCFVQSEAEHPSHGLAHAKNWLQLGRRQWRLCCPQAFERTPQALTQCRPPAAQLLTARRQSTPQGGLGACDGRKAATQSAITNYHAIQLLVRGGLPLRGDSRTLLHLQPTVAAARSKGSSGPLLGTASCQQCALTACRCQRHTKYCHASVIC